MSEHIYLIHPKYFPTLRRIQGGYVCGDTEQALCKLICSRDHMHIMSEITEYVILYSFRRKRSWVGEIRTLTLLNETQLLGQLGEVAVFTKQKTNSMVPLSNYTLFGNSLIDVATAIIIIEYWFQGFYLVSVWILNANRCRYSYHKNK